LISLEELAALVSEVFGDPMVEPSRLLEEDPPNYSIAFGRPPPGDFYRDA